MGKIFVLLPAVVLLQILSAEAEVHIECIRNRDDFDHESIGLGPGYEWEYTQRWTWKYAASLDSLPAVFQGNLNGTGVFFADGDAPDYEGFYSFVRMFDEDEGVPANTSPSYLYLRYYLHPGSSDSKVNLAVRPALNVAGNAKSLPRSSNFEWSEALVELDIEVAQHQWLGLIGYNLEEGNYFLLDTIALIQGQVLNSAGDAAALCDSQPRSPAAVRRSPRASKLL